MKALFALIVTSFLFISCSKTSQTQTSFTFKVNGQAYDWSGKSNLNYSELLRYNMNGDEEYILISRKGMNPDSANWAFINIILRQPTLEVKFYSDRSALDCEILLPAGGTTHNATKFATDSVRLTITNIHDGLADGSFSARLSGNAPEEIITDGVFKNVTIIQ
jgi:hypothetical protein